MSSNPTNLSLTAEILGECDHFNTQKSIVAKVAREIDKITNKVYQAVSLDIDAEAKRTNELAKKVDILHNQATTLSQ